MIRKCRPSRDVSDPEEENTCISYAPQQCTQTESLLAFFLVSLAGEGNGSDGDFFSDCISAVLLQSGSQKTAIKAYG